MRGLVVDVDGVIIVPRPGGWARDLKADLGLSYEALATHFFSEHWEDVVTGKAGLHERLGPVLARLAPHLTSQELAAYWFSTDAILDTVLLDDLAKIRRSGVALHLATVQDHERARFLWSDLGLHAQFDAMHYSAQIGFKKSNPRFYAAIEARTGFAAGELVLVDDTLSNVEMARAAGWGGVHWTGAEPIGVLLAALGGAA